VPYVIQVHGLVLNKGSIMEHFNEFKLPEALNHTLEAMQFTTPTPIQAQAIPPAMQGRDILGSAQTGTGKTAAFGVPLVAKLISNPQGSALVMTPTRELATQVMQQLQALLGKRSKIKTALLIGGESMPKQLQQLRQNARVIVGTPGRINDHLTRGSLKLRNADFLVLDETDRMLDMGFTVQIEKILKHMPDERQTLLFSATLPKDIVRMTDKYLKNPVRVAVDPTSAPAKNITHEMVRVVSNDDKYDQLLEQLNTRDGSIIIFVKTKYGTEKMAKKLAKLGHEAEAIHGDLRQNKRDRVIKAFRQNKYRILVATDVAARGLDIPHIEHVINYDLPQCAEDYIHRIGRTARAGAEGSAMCFVTPADKGKWYAIHRLLDPEAAANDEQPMPSRGKRRDGGKPKRFNKNGPRRPQGEKRRENRQEKRGDKRQGGDATVKDRSTKPNGGKPKTQHVRADRPSGGKPKTQNARNGRPNGGKPKQQSAKPRPNKHKAPRRAA
jgi:ATP-dependent RNA helicase DeaD